MKRSRSGCRTCRTRRIKCDEGRPICKNCTKRGIECTYEIKYQWILQEGVHMNEKFSTKSPRSNAKDPNLKVSNQPDTSGGIKSKDHSALKKRQGPFSRKRILGQAVLNAGCFRPSALKNLNTVMQEVEFSSDDEPVTELNGPGSLNQFKKFKISSIHETKVPRVGPDPMLKHSPLHRPVLFYPHMNESVPHMSLDMPYEHTVSARPEMPTPMHSHTPSQSHAHTSSHHLHPDSNRSYHIRHPHGSRNSVSTHETPNSNDHRAAHVGHAHHTPEPLDAFVAEKQSTSLSVSPSAIFSSSISAITSRTKPNPNDLLSLSGLTDQDFFDHFVDHTADALVPIPYEENPFLSLLPRLAATNPPVRDLIVAYGASHKSMMIHGLASDPVDDAIVDNLVSRCVSWLDLLQEEKTTENDELALLAAVMLAMIKIDRGETDAWLHYMKLSLEIIRLRLNYADWHLEAEINSMTFRLVGYLCGIGNILSLGKELLEFPYWPQWSGSLDYLTGMDLNMLPMFCEAAELIRKMDTEGHGWTLRERALVNVKALRIFHRMNDYWIEDFWPDSEITAMCIMFQESLQLHVLRRILKFPTEHPTVQRIVALSMRHLERWVPPASTMQRCMNFILVTVASESLVPEHRTSLLIRLHHMGEAGFAYNLKLCDEIKRHWKANTSLIAEPTLWKF